MAALLANFGKTLFIFVREQQIKMAAP